MRITESRLRRIIRQVIKESSFGGFGMGYSDLDDYGGAPAPSPRPQEIATEEERIARAQEQLDDLDLPATDPKYKGLCIHIAKIHGISVDQLNC